MSSLVRTVVAFILLGSPQVVAPAAITAATNKTTAHRGSLVSIEPLGAMDQAKLQRIAADFPGDIGVHIGARLFRVVYWSALKGTPTRASGLLVLPTAVGRARGTVLFLHGTNATRALAPSQPGRVDGNEEAAVFAGNGYVVVLPDYLGLGVSKIPHPYLIADPSVAAAVDLLAAAREVTTRSREASSPNLFVMGFSQGGQVAAAVHREIERRPLAGYRLRGSIGIAGPYDLARASLPKAIENNCRLCVAYLTWAAYAYATYYGHPLGEALTPHYAAIVPGLFDGSHTAQEIGSALPDNPAEAFQPEFLSAMRTGAENWFTRALAENETYAWVPVAPMRLYFGDADVDVPPAAAQAFYNYARARGGNVSLHPMADADHQASSARTYAPALAWFDELSAEQ